jgi:hypothetical protein
MELAAEVLVLAVSAPPGELPQGVTLAREHRYTLPLSGAPRLLLRYSRGG